MPSLVIIIFPFQLLSFLKKGESWEHESWQNEEISYFYSLKK